MKKNIAVFLLILLAISFSVGCSKNIEQNTSVESQSTLTIGLMPDVDSIPFIIAEHNGYFKDEGLNIKIEHFKSAMDRDTAIQTGNIDGAISDMLAVVFLNDNNFDIKITSKTDGSFKLISSKQSNITDLKQFNNNSIGISKNTIIEYLTNRILDANDVSIDAIEKVAIPKIPTRLEMLQNGKLDSATLPEPLASVAISNDGNLLNSSDQLGINPGVMIFTSKSINEKPDEIKALYRAYNKAVQYLISNQKEDYIDVLIKEAGFPEIVKDTLSLPQYTNAAMPEEKEFNEVMNWLKSKELTKNNYSLKELSTNNFIH